jgi:hypothetical protein
MVIFAAVLSSITIVLMVYLWGWVTGLNDSVERLQECVCDLDKRVVDIEKFLVLK